MKHALLWVIAACILCARLASAQVTHAGRLHNLMPIPAEVSFGDGQLSIDSTFRVAMTGHKEVRLSRAAKRLVLRLSRETGIPVNAEVSNDSGMATLHVRCEREGNSIPSLREDESYALVVTSAKARLIARSPYGVLRGLETFVQLVESGPEGFRAPAVRIADAPRFPWRGLLIDVCRHWMPMEVLKRNLDAMAAVKLNVLHWHLSEDQGFRIESKRFPKLHTMGSDGMYYTQEETREIISYAADRGIRVVPEFDMPGHTTSWFVGHPELASAPGPYQIEPSWGVFDPTMDPSREEVYKFLDTFIGEMAALFPDQYFHIGGDEVNGKQWNTNQRIQTFKRKNKMKDNHDLQVYFNRRLLSLLTKHSKKMVGWDEVFHPDLPKDIVVQSWRGQKSLADAAQQGYQGILSFGYYLDHMRAASYHYSVDPLDSGATELTPDQKRSILGGEACMWAEFVTAENIDSRIWPRTAAIAERLWSPAEVMNSEDMYRRLGVVSQRLEWLGVRHRSVYALMLRRLAGYESPPSQEDPLWRAGITPLQTLADVLEPVKFYERPRSRAYTSLTPLNRLVDATRPESERAREFSTMIQQLLADSSRARHVETIRSWLSEWRDNDAKLRPLFETSFLLKEIDPVSRNLTDVAETGLRALKAFENGMKVDRTQSNEWLTFLDRAGQAQAELILMIAPPVRRLVEVVLPVR